MKNVCFLMYSILCFMSFSFLQAQIEKGESIESSSTTITYNIVAHNRNGSFTVEIGMGVNEQTGKRYGYIREKDENGIIVREITPEILNKQLRYLSELNTKFQEQKLENNQLETMIVSLKDFKATLEDEEKVQALIATLKNANTESGLPFSYIISSIRGKQEQVSGTIGD